MTVLPIRADGHAPLSVAAGSGKRFFSSPVLAGLGLSVTIHAAFLFVSRDWRQAPPVIGGEAAAVSVALVSLSMVRPAAKTGPSDDREKAATEEKPLPEPHPDAKGKTIPKALPEGRRAVVKNRADRPARIPPKSVSRPRNRKAPADPRFRADRRPVVNAAPPSVQKPVDHPAQPRLAPHEEAAPPVIDNANAPPSAKAPAHDMAASEPVVNLSPRFRRQPVPPPYPRRARRLGQEGTVVIRALLDTRGDVTKLRLVSSSGFELLDQAALKAVKKWRFVPARRHGKAVTSWVQVPVRFQLK